MKIIIETEIPKGVWCEDRWIGHVLAEAGVQPVRKPDYNFYPRGMVLQMNVPTPTIMRSLT